MGVENRSAKRVKSCLQAFASDLAEKIDIKCMIRDMSTGGCLLVSSRVEEIPRFFNLTPEGFDKPIRGKIAWRTHNMAGVQLLPDDDPELKSAIETLLVRAMDSDDFGANDTVLVLTGTKAPLDYAQRLRKLRGERLPAENGGLH